MVLTMALKLHLLLHCLSRYSSYTHLGANKCQDSLYLWYYDEADNAAIWGIPTLAVATILASRALRFTASRRALE